MRSVIVAGACVMVVSCTGTPPSPEATPLFAGRAGDIALGLRQLTDTQARTLQDVIVSSGVPCGAIQRTYLQAMDGVAEVWNVRCPEASYVVELFRDLEPPNVAICASVSIMDTPCFQTDVPLLRPDRFGRPSNRLDPRLKDLLETTPD